MEYFILSSQEKESQFGRFSSDIRFDLYQLPEMEMLLQFVRD